MFNRKKQIRIDKYAADAKEYEEKVYEPYKPKPASVKGSSDSGVKYSLRGSSFTDDILFEKKFSNEVVKRAMSNFSRTHDASELLDSIGEAERKTFMDCVISYIKEGGVRDSYVYKAAQLDRRLFSKMISDKYYKPAKDTALAIAFALHLTLEEATDLLGRAGYTLSHSNKRDIIIEYFFIEGIYNLSEVNEVLHKLNQKIIGR